jgi:hypothetical protein
LAKSGGRCVVEGKQVDPITIDVAPKEAAPFKLRVSGVSAAAMPQPEGQPARVEVRGPIAFEGGVAPDKVPWKTAKEVTAMSGMVHLAAATEGLTLYATAFARVVTADVQLGSVHIRGMQLPCAGLTLDAVKAPEAKTLPEESGDSYMAATKVLHFRGGPGSGAQVEVALGDDLTALDLHKVEAQKEWLRVSSHWADGTTLVGWVKKNEVKPAPTRHEPLGEAFLPSSSCKRELATRPGERVATVKVTTGTQVFAARFVGAWGTVKSGEPLKVRWLPKDDWVSIVEVPGIVSASECPDHSTVLDEAWVPMKAVQLPKEGAKKETKDTASPDGGT